VVSSKIIFLKVLSGLNFGEFLGFFLKGFKPYKIQAKFKT
jgi:hypothetical protein